MAVCIGSLAAYGAQQPQLAVHRQSTAPVMRIVAQQAVQAMHDDAFYTTYSRFTLFIHGTVSSITRRGGRSTILVLGGRGGSVSCDLGTHSSPISVGRAITIKVADPQRDVARASDGLAIAPCELARDM